MPTLDYQRNRRSRPNRSRLAIFAIAMSLTGAALLLGTMIVLPSPGGHDQWATFVWLNYAGCLFIGMILSSIAYTLNPTQRLFCFIAFLVSACQILLLLCIALASMLLFK